MRLCKLCFDAGLSPRWARHARLTIGWTHRFGKVEAAWCERETCVLCVLHWLIAA